MLRSRTAWVVLGAAMECGYLGMLLAARRSDRPLLPIAFFLAVFVLYLVAIKGAVARDPSGAVVLVLACLFRLTFLPAQPFLSHDLDRYEWDGRVLLASGNPYLEPPGHRAPIEHGEVPTIYPPVSQALFALGAVLAPGGAGIKLLVVLADLLVIVVLRALLRLRGRPEAAALIYAWSPLAVTETAWSGHIEPWGLLCVLLAAGAIIQKQDVRGTLLLATGSLVKLFPLVLIVPFLRTIRKPVLLLAPLLIAVAYFPFRAAGWGVFAGLRVYADRWLGNESLFAIVLGAFRLLDPTSTLKTAIAWVRRSVPHTGALDSLYAYVYPIDLAKGACALVFAALAALIVWKRVDPLRGCFLLTGAALLLSPTAHPWYFLWILPWLCFFPSRAFLLLTGLVVLSYANLGAASRESEPFPWIRLVEYLPFYALLGFELASRWSRHRRAESGMLDSAP